jgi:hypothetical protein
MNHQELLSVPRPPEWILNSLELSVEPRLEPLYPGGPAVWTGLIDLPVFAPAGELAARWSDREVRKRETFGGKTLVAASDSRCAFSCGEVEIAARLRRVGGRAWWVSEWASYQVPPGWDRFFIRRSRLRDQLPDLARVDARVRQAGSLRSSGGHPDIAAWKNPAQPCYLEFKGPGDSVKPAGGQAAWIAAAQRLGLPFMVVVGEVR